MCILYSNGVIRLKLLSLELKQINLWLIVLTYPSLFINLVPLPMYITFPITCTSREPALILITYPVKKAITHKQRPKIPLLLTMSPLYGVS